MYKREYYKTLIARLSEPRGFIQVVTGPRQIGKTTMVQQVLENIHVPSLYRSADGQIDDTGFWINNAWEEARLMLKTRKFKEIILCFDEIQKINQWSEHVKREWDHDTMNNIPVKLVLLGSSRLLIQEGLSESLSGRFESISMSHWSFNEMKSAFGFDHDQYVFFGGYPGAVRLISNEIRWADYVRDSLIETAISKDIYQMTRINKPALLRRLFELSVQYSGELVSFTKMLGQLQDPGNTVTLAHYLALLETAGLVSGIQKYSHQQIRQRASSPKLQVFNTALKGSLSGLTFSQLRSDPPRWGRFVESAIGAHLLNQSINQAFKVFYWRDRNMEVDFIIQQGNKITALEVKSGKPKSFSGLNEFKRRIPTAKINIIGTGGIPWQTFLESDPSALL